MRVAYVCSDPGVPVFGHKGCSVHVREMCRTMRTRGCEVTLFTTRRGGDAPDDLHDMVVIDLPAPTSRDAERRELECIAANEAVMRLLDETGPFDVVYERASLWSVAAMRYALRSGAAGILELNAPLVDEQARYRTLVHHTLAQALLADALRTARTVAAVSEAVAVWARALAGDATRVHVVANGVDPQRFSRFARDGTTRDHFAVGFVGTLKPWHGLATLVDAFCEFADTVPAARLLIVGDGPERHMVETRLRDSGLTDRAILTGAVEHDEVSSWLARMDVAVAPYPPLETFYFSPLKLTEYMASGVPVIASAIGPITAIIDHEETGLLVPPGDSAALVAALRRLHGDSALRDRLACAACDSVATQFTWDHVVERIFALAGLPAAPRQSELVGVGARLA